MFFETGPIYLMRCFFVKKFRTCCHQSHEEIRGNYSRSSIPSARADPAGVLSESWVLAGLLRNENVQNDYWDISLFYSSSGKKKKKKKDKKKKKTFYWALIEGMVNENGWASILAYSPKSTRHWLVLLPVSTPQGKTGDNMKNWCLSAMFKATWTEMKSTDLSNSISKLF